MSPRHVRFRDPAGFTRTGYWTNDGIEAAGRTFDVDEVTVLPPVEPTKVIGVGARYRSSVETLDLETPEFPRMYFKGGPNVVASHEGTITLLEDKEMKSQPELGAVMGEQCRHVDVPDAMDAVAGFTCVNDVTNVDNPDEYIMFQGKSFDNAAPMGPVVASTDVVPLNPRIRLWRNGELVSDSKGDEIIFTIAEVIAAFSDLVTLEPDDVILLGATGFGPLEDGDTVEIEIEGVGTLRHYATAP